MSNSTEASNDAPVVPEVEISWNGVPSDDDMANDTDECQALIEDHDDKDIGESSTCPTIFSPAQSHSSGRIEAGLSRRRSSSPPIEL
jgi:hypothetical protein